MTSTASLLGVPCASMQSNKNSRHVHVFISFIQTFERYFWIKRKIVFPFERLNFSSPMFLKNLTFNIRIWWLCGICTISGINITNYVRVWIGLKEHMAVAGDDYVEEEEDGYVWLIDRILNICPHVPVPRCNWSMKWWLRNNISFS